jgi:hypothetical protein
MATYDDLADRLAPLNLDIVMPGVSEYSLPCITLEPDGIEVRDGQKFAWENATISVRFPLGTNNPNVFIDCQKSAYEVFQQLIGSPFIVGTSSIFGAPDIDHPAMLYAVAVTFPGPYPICERIPSAP